MTLASTNPRAADVDQARLIQRQLPPQRGRVVQIQQVHHSLLHRAVRRAYWTARWFWWRTRMASIGPGARIDRPSWVVGAESIVLGENVQIWRFSRLEALNAGRGIRRITIEQGTAIQPFAHIAAVESIRIGQGCLFASHVYITDHDHEFSDPMDPVCTNDKVKADPVTIGDFVWLGERAMVLKGVTIGERSIIGAGSIVTHDVPAMSIAVGAPARVVRRWNERTGAWERADQP